MNFGKRQLVLAALVVALGAAVYINWQFSSGKDLVATNSVSSSSELGEATYVNNQVTSQGSSSETTVSSEVPSSGNSTAGESTTSSTDQKDYFSQAILNRQKARDEAKDMLKEIIESAKSTDEAKTKATEQLNAMATNIEQESNIENLVKAKNYPNCVACIQNNECSVVISCPQGLLESDAVVVKDIVYGQSGISPSKIKIIEAK